jgi:predicted Zn-dependent peptidase
MTYFTHTLPNGLRIIHQPDASPVAYCGLAVNVGTRDELPHEHGMAHFIEHLLFKGTTHRKAWYILNCMEEVGGELNAYTTKEETFVYAAFLEEYYEKALALIADMAANSTFPEKETIKETDIILDEIESYNDTPSELIFDRIEELLFDGYPIGRNILGSKESITAFSHEDITSFHARHYRADRMVFFSLGQTDFKKVVRLAEKHLSAIAAPGPDCGRTAPEVYNVRHLTENRDTHQLHYMLGTRAYPLHHPDRLALSFLNNMLGGPGMNSKLNLSLRERSGLVYNVESGYTPYTDTGVLNIYFGCDPKNGRRCAQLIRKELDALMETPLNPRYLEKAKRQMLGQLAISSENKENLALSMGRSFLHFNRFDGINQIAEKLESITSEKIQSIARELFHKDCLTSLTFKE